MSSVLFECASRKCFRNSSVVATSNLQCVHLWLVGVRCVLWWSLSVYGLAVLNSHLSQYKSRSRIIILCKLLPDDTFSLNVNLLPDLGLVGLVGLMELGELLSSSEEEDSSSMLKVVACARAILDFLQSDLLRSHPRGAKTKVTLSCVTRVAWFPSKSASVSIKSFSSIDQEVYHCRCCYICAARIKLS